MVEELHAGWFSCCLKAGEEEQIVREGKGVAATEDEDRRETSIRQAEQILVV